MDSKEELKLHFDSFYANSDSRFKSTINYINQKYQKKELFFKANEFTNSLIALLTAKNLQAYSVKLIASLDAMSELNTSINLSFMFFYKSAFDSLRRAIEITVLGQYYELVENDCETIFNWIDSKSNTPNFQKMINDLLSVQIFSEINSNFEWKKEVQNHYSSLCGYIHTKGSKKSIISTNKSNFFKPAINIESLDEFLSYYITTVQQIAIIYSINNPILIIGLPTLEKFGFITNNGLFNDSQAQNLRDLLPQKYMEYVLQLVNKDSDIEKRIHEIKNLPDSKNYLEIKDIIEKIKNNV